MYHIYLFMNIFIFYMSGLFIYLHIYFTYIIFILSFRYLFTNLFYMYHIYLFMNIFSVSLVCIFICVSFRWPNFIRFAALTCLHLLTYMQYAIHNTYVWLTIFVPNSIYKAPVIHSSQP